MMGPRISVAAQYGDAAQYVPEGSAAALERLPRSAWGELVEACAEHLMAGDEPGIDCQVIATSEALDDFIAASQEAWRSYRSSEGVEVAGLAALYFEGVVSARGEPARNLVVIDCGDLRAVLIS